MAQRSLPAKVRMMVNLLLGTRHVEVHRALVPFGWSQERLAEGWRLVERVGTARFSEAELSFERRDAELLAFKKRWFSIVRIALENRWPEFVERLVGGPQLWTVAGAATLVAPFLDALAELEASPHDKERAARELLRERGLSAEVVESARTWVLHGRASSAEAAPSLPSSEAEAERALWNFYLEWSGIARREVSNRATLRLLGLYKPGRAPATSDDEEEEEVEVRVVSMPSLPVFSRGLPRLAAPAPRALPSAAEKKTEDTKKKSKSRQRRAGSAE